MSNTTENNLIGKKIQFHAERIMAGNPVEGFVISENEEWIEVKLSKDIEGMANAWYEGEEKQFRKSLIHSISILP